MASRTRKELLATQLEQQKIDHDESTVEEDDEEYYDEDDGKIDGGDDDEINDEGLLYGGIVCPILRSRRRRRLLMEGMLKPITDARQVTIEKSNNIHFVIPNPGVLGGSTSNTCINIGKANIENPSSQLQTQAGVQDLQPKTLADCLVKISTEGLLEKMKLHVKSCPHHVYK